MYSDRNYWVYLMIMMIITVTHFVYNLTKKRFLSTPGQILQLPDYFMNHHSYYILGMHSQTATKKMLLALGEVKNYLLHLNIINPKLVSKMLLSVMAFIDINPVFLLL